MLRRMKCIPSADNLSLVVEASCFAHSLDNLEHRHAFTLSKVVSLVSSICGAVVKDMRLRGQCIEGEQVSLCEVHDVEIVSHTSAIAIYR